MTVPIRDQVKRALQAAEGLYYRLVLLVGETGTGKTVALRAVADDLGVPVININLELSARLLELTSKQRALRLPEILDQIAGAEGSTVVLDNLEILFDKELKQDPLRLLQSVSRNRCVVASWNGLAEKGKLIYAEAGHPEYRNYGLSDTLLVRMDSAVEADSIKDTREAGQA
ncbi:MAG: BREX-3 system P-loop-containing protein BrxF [Actinomycetota bacterium]|nr:BREX-3 system P-loop-containing protein BrxF [Actinomycetota bacterium]